MFFGGIAGACLYRDRLVLEAVAAEVMPHRLILSGVEPSAFFELRDYGADWARLRGALDRHGVRAAKEDRGRVLFAFPTLAAREKAWRDVGADAAGASVREIAVYRTVVGQGRALPPALSRHLRK
jgi:uncharacterized lipoprotein